MANPPHNAPGADPPVLWFTPPGADEQNRRALTRERVVAEALAMH